MLKRDYLSQIFRTFRYENVFIKKFTNSITKKEPRGDVIWSSSSDGLDSVSQLVEAVVIFSLQEVLEVLEEELVFHQELDVGTVETTEISCFVNYEQPGQPVNSPYLRVSSMASSSSTFSPQDCPPPPWVLSAEARERSEEGRGAARQTERRTRRPSRREEQEQEVLMLMFDVRLPLWVRADWAGLAWHSPLSLSPLCDLITDLTWHPPAQWEIKLQHYY